MAWPNRAELDIFIMDVQCVWLFCCSVFIFVASLLTMVRVSLAVIKSIRSTHIVELRWTWALLQIFTVLSFCLQYMLIYSQLVIARENRTSRNQRAINMDHCPCLWLYCKVSISRYLLPLSMSRQSFDSAEDMMRTEKSMRVTRRTGECHNS